MGYLYRITDKLFINEQERLTIVPLAVLDCSVFMVLTESIFTEFIQNHETVMNGKESPIRKYSNDKNIGKKDIYKKALFYQNDEEALRLFSIFFKNAMFVLELLQ